MREHSVESWADRIVELGAPVTRCSSSTSARSRASPGSEAHLLTLLPGPARARLGRTLLPPARGRAGSVGVRRAARRRGSPGRGGSAQARRRPARVLTAAASRAPRATGAPAHASRPRGCLRPARGEARPGARAREHEARVQRFPGGTRVRARRPRARPTRATCTSRSRPGLARYLAETEGFDAASFEVVHYGIAAGPEPPAPPASPRLLCVGRLVPIKGHELLLRAFAEARREVPALELEIAGEGPLRDGARRAGRGSSRSSDAVHFVGACRTDRARLRACGGRRRPVARRGVRHGRARSGGAWAGGDRVGGRRAARDRRRRPHRHARSAPATPRRSPAAIVELATRAGACRRDGSGCAASARLPEFSLDRCADRIDALYRSALARRAR